MEKNRLYPNKNGEVSSVCPQCGKLKTIKAHQHLGKTEIKITCSCGCSYEIFIDFRKYYRKNLKLFGKCYTEDKKKETEVAIENLSRSGLGFSLFNPLKLRKGEKLNVTFTLDDKKRSVVTKKIIIRRVDDLFVGAEFDPHIDQRDIDLAFYLMFK